MEFFIPTAETPDIAERTYNGTKSLAKDNGWEITDRRIFQIEYSDRDKYHKAEVGEFSNINNETVMAILESNAYYLICTPNSGVFRSIPIRVGRHEIRLIEDFGGRKELI